MMTYARRLALAVLLLPTVGRGRPDDADETIRRSYLAYYSARNSLARAVLEDSVLWRQLFTDAQDAPDFHHDWDAGRHSSLEDTRVVWHNDRMALVASRPVSMDWRVGDTAFRVAVLCAEPGRGWTVACDSPVSDEICELLGHPFVSPSNRSMAEARAAFEASLDGVVLKNAHDRPGMHTHLSRMKSFSIVAKNDRVSLAAAVVEQVTTSDNPLAGTFFDDREVVGLLSTVGADWKINAMFFVR